MITIALEAASLALAAALARRTPSPRQSATVRAFAAMLAISVVRVAVATLPGRTERLVAWAAGTPPPPYEGAARWAWSAGAVALWSWYAVTAWLVWRVLATNESPGPVASREDQGPGLTREGADDDVPKERSRARQGRSPRALMVAAPAAVVALYFAYPILRGRAAELAAAGVKAASLLVILIAASVGVLRWQAPAREDRAAWLTAWLLVVSAIVSAAGPWLLGQPIRDWYLAAWVSIPTWSMIGGVQLWAMSRLGSR